MVIANYMVEFTDMDQLWMVVTPQNPFKQKESMLKDYDRLHLVNLAIGDDLRLRGSDIEFKLPQPNYTSDSLAYLKEKFPERNLKGIIELTPTAVYDISADEAKAGKRLG